eukprot:TRINITY_DN1325_c0_g1_i1.p1 TRINITY_DN1325_c0_g1~~TRINITY_DN1325_c0_g1_i1.p1  ORF type:complete len:169 (-),score=43.33 TRINITY_DN1325_c0_g1_i1:375-881(-)
MVKVGFHDFQKILDLYPEHTTCKKLALTSKIQSPHFYNSPSCTSDNDSDTDLTETNENDNNSNNEHTTQTNTLENNNNSTSNYIQHTSSSNTLNAFDYALLHPPFEPTKLENLELIDSSFYNTVHPPFNSYSRPTFWFPPSTSDTHNSFHYHQTPFCSTLHHSFSIAT